jgi:polyhydroxybutyrate depolymerase
MPFSRFIPCTVALSTAVALTAACGAPAPSDDVAADESSSSLSSGSPFHDATPGPIPAVACSGKRWTPGDHVVTVTSGGITRKSRIHVPLSYNPKKGTPLVFNFHGVHQDAIQEEVLTGMDVTSEARGFIVAYPDGTGGFLDQSWNAGNCCGPAGESNVDDVAFVRTLLASLEEDYCVDPARIYATGFSNGAYFTNRLACEMADVFAAVAPVSGILSLDQLNCTPARPIPYLGFHGTADPVVIFNGGTGILGHPNAPVEETVALWRAKDGCSAASTVIYKKGDVTCTRWGQCAAGGDVIQCIIAGGGHTWPGGVPTLVVGKTTFDVSANSAMADFFEAHPMR